MDRTHRAGRLRDRMGRQSRVIVAVVAVLTGAGAGPGEPASSAGLEVETLTRQAKALAGAALRWYEATPPADRITWGGLAAASALALGVLLERWARLRRRSIVPVEFEGRFLERLQSGALGRGKALDYCELNPSPASRVALAAVKRWGRPAADLERAVVLAHRVEADRLRRHVGTMRRLAVLTPLLGLIGTLTAVSRALNTVQTGTAWGPALAAALWPFTAGVVIATLALVAYDGLAGRVEQLISALDRIGAATIDAIAMALPLDPPARPDTTVGAAVVPHHQGANPPSPARTPHQVRMEVPKPKPRPSPRVPIDDDEDYE